jgi:microcystin degradation protein MlrC
MSLRIGIAGFMQESNTFAPRCAEESDFQVSSGEKLLRFFEDTNSEIAGFLDICAEQAWEAVPMMAAGAISGGPLSGNSFESLSTQILDSIAREKVDAVLLALHGAMSSERFPSADAEFAQRVRATVGSDLPFVVSHDFHANLTAPLLAAVDGISGCAPTRTSICAKRAAALPASSLLFCPGNGLCIGTCPSLRSFRPSPRRRLKNRCDPL